MRESVDHQNQYWDSDEYVDDEDGGYMRQPIEDEARFLDHKKDYPSDNEKGTGHGNLPDPQESSLAKHEEEDQCFAEEDSYLSGKEHIQQKNVEPVTASYDHIGQTVTKMYGRTNDNDVMM